MISIMTGCLGNDPIISKDGQWASFDIAENRNENKTVWVKFKTQNKGIVPFLKKGAVVQITSGLPEVNTYQKKDGTWCSDYFYWVNNLKLIKSSKSEEATQPYSSFNSHFG